jgi:hypothetical protein
METTFRTSESSVHFGIFHEIWADRQVSPTGVGRAALPRRPNFHPAKFLDRWARQA